MASLCSSNEESDGDGLDLSLVVHSSIKKQQHCLEGCSIYVCKFNDLGSFIESLVAGRCCYDAIVRRIPQNLNKVELGLVRL